jgi:hypothetical protein
MSDRSPTGGAGNEEGTTLTEVLSAYEDSGFGSSFTVTDDAGLECHECLQVSRPEDVTMSSMRRMEGASDPDDMMAIAAITCPRCGAQGTITLGFGPAATGVDGDVLLALRDNRGDSHLPGNSAPGETTGDGEGPFR